MFDQGAKLFGAQIFVVKPGARPQPAVGMPWFTDLFSESVCVCMFVYLFVFLYPCEQNFVR